MQPDRQLAINLTILTINKVSMKKKTLKEYVVYFQFKKKEHSFGHIAVTASSETKARKIVNELYKTNSLNDYVDIRITNSTYFDAGRLTINKPQRLNKAY